MFPFQKKSLSTWLALSSHESVHLWNGFGVAPIFCKLTYTTCTQLNYNSDLNIMTCVIFVRYCGWPIVKCLRGDVITLLHMLKCLNQMNFSV